MEVNWDRQQIEAIQAAMKDCRLGFLGRLERGSKDERMALAHIIAVAFSDKYNTAEEAIEGFFREG